jgi:hypothetical protein
MIGEVIAFRDGCERAADKTGILLWKGRFDADWLILKFHNRWHRNEEEKNAGEMASFAETEKFSASDSNRPFTGSSVSSVKIFMSENRKFEPCSREDSNLQGLPHALLRRTRLPVPPREQIKRL